MFTNDGKSILHKNESLCKPLGFAVFPDTVYFYDRMGIEAARKTAKIGGAWRLWILARRLDFVGTGRIARDELRAYVADLGVKPRTWQRWIDQARAHGFLTDIQKADGNFYLIIASDAAAAKAQGWTSIGTRRIAMPAAALVAPGWKAKVFSAWEDGKTISRERIQKTINVPVSTQTYRDRQAGTVRTRNVCKTELKADAAQAVKAFTDHKAVYVTRDGFVAWRLPDARQSKHGKRLGKGRSAKANKSLNHGGLFQQCKQALSHDARQATGFIRLFNSTPDQLTKSQRYASRQNRRPSELYLKAETTERGVVVWHYRPATKEQ